MVVRRGPDGRAMTPRSALGLLLAACSPAPEPAPTAPAAPAAPARPTPAREVAQDPPWIAAGDVRPHQATIWAHTGILTRVRAEAWRADDPSQTVQWRSALAEPAAPPAAPTAHLLLEDLPPGTDLGYRVLTGDGRQAEGRLRTPPEPVTAAAVHLLVAGDLGGQGWCRPPQGYAIFDAMAALTPDLAVFNGDLVYADGDCPPTAPDGGENVVLPTGHPQSVLGLDWTDGVAVRRGLDAWWAYHRADPALQRFLAQVPVVAQWDDHEVVNDFGGGWDRWETGQADKPGYRILVDQARAAWLAWNPVQLDAPGRIHRSFRWGQQVELFVVDGRSHRSSNAMKDGPDKTLLGAEQRDWLRKGLVESDATWKIVSVDVPMSVPTGSDAWRAGRDGWANGTGDSSTPPGERDRSPTTGFEHELSLILGDLREHRIQGVVFVTTDVHHSRILRYDNGPAPVHEVISGPLRAWSGPPTPLDPTFAPREIFAQGQVFSFARLAVDEVGALTIEIRGEDGQVLPGATVVLPPPERP